MGKNPDADNKIITCWCGATGTYKELFDVAVYGENCGGSGFLECLCGGDQCVCHHHGQSILCPGCDDCARDDHWDGDYDDQYDDEE